MSEWLDNQKQSSSSMRQLLQERIEKASPRGQLTAKEAKRLIHPEVTNTLQGELVNYL